MLLVVQELLMLHVKKFHTCPLSLVDGKLQKPTAEIRLSVQESDKIHPVSEHNELLAFLPQSSQTAGRLQTAIIVETGQWVINDHDHIAEVATALQKRLSKPKDIISHAAQIGGRLIP